MGRWLPVTLQSHLIPPDGASEILRGFHAELHVIKMHLHFFKKDLFEKVIRMLREEFSIYWFNPQIATTARTEAGQSQEPELHSCQRVPETDDSTKSKIAFLFLYISKLSVLKFINKG